MNAVSSAKGKAIFQVLFVILFQPTSTTYRLNLYDTDQILDSTSLHYDCINYRIYRETWAYQELFDVVDEVIPYCPRPANHQEKTFVAPVDPPARKLYFEQMRIANISAKQLLSWSVPIEIAERYQFYLNAPDVLLNEYFFNCTEPNFGLYCQYSFPMGAGTSFNQIIEEDFLGRIAYFGESDLMVEVPCYILISCHRNGQFWCLDWREICDGMVDCFDEGLDEDSCSDMEINECSEDEYRCHNGLCISQDLWADGLGDTDCLDRSDTAIYTAYINSCFQDPTFRCEEHTCRVSDNIFFSCGDGQCVSKFSECHNGRHFLLMNSTAAKGNLTHECWIAMICLTELVKTGNKSLCYQWLMNNTVDAFLKQCDLFFQFPAVPIYSNYIFSFYQYPHLTLNESQSLLPDYFCYDQQLCDSIIPDLIRDNLTCINKTRLRQNWNIYTNFWSKLIGLLGEKFRSCSVFRDISRHKIDYDGYPSLYKCQNSSKFISKHRILDGIRDCFREDDEHYEDSCLLNDPYRVICHKATNCWSPLVKDKACILNKLEDSKKISFQSFCDGIDQYFYDKDGKRQTDELRCDNRSCNTIYTRCDGFWACLDKHDEDNCGQTICPSQTYPCISPINYTMICLPYEGVNNETSECLGNLDEQYECRSTHPSMEVSYPFHCLASSRCIPVSQLCDTNVDCPQGDDEKFCNNQRVICDQDSTYNGSDAEKVVCALNEYENRRVKHFSLYTCSNYPLLDKSAVSDFYHWPGEHHVTSNGNLSQVKDNLWPWYCNRGLVVHISNKSEHSNRTCFCPPSYYDDLCQYQNQRISLTLRLTSNERSAIYAIVSMLISNDDERQEIDAYDQYVYIAKQSCSMKLNRYLLFSTRPKNISKNYNVRIDAYEKTSMTYVGSWHFPVTFLFLPVNRLSISLSLSNHILHRPSNCEVTCNNGECVKYVNKNTSFCRCNPNWSGIQCNIPMNCHACSLSSICIGSVNNRSICVCPVDRFGPRCSLTSTCPINACQNNGRCLPADVTISENDYSCICSDRFFGQYCELRKAKLDVALNEISIPSYLVAYFFTLSNQSEPVETTILRKLTLFQRIIPFHIAISFHLVIIQANDKYYLAALQQSPKADISTSISARQECTPIERLLNDTILNMTAYQRVIYFHVLCQTDYTLTCFIDNDYLCLCTTEHHANCIEFNHQRNFQCPLNNYCANKGHCLQDHPTCPSTKICLCSNCFFGNRCQFYAKGLGSTLDEILGYEFKRDASLSKQTFTVKVAATMTILLFTIGMINSILSIATFTRKKTQETGCGLYLLVSSIISLSTMIFFMLKFWLLFVAHQNSYSQHSQQLIWRGNCYIEPLIKMFIYIGNWLDACVAIERTISVFQGIGFNKRRFRRAAIWVLLLLLVIISCLLIPQVRHLHIFNDGIEERNWCVVQYFPWLESYTTIMIFIHYFVPLIINIFAIVGVIFMTTRQRIVLQSNRSFLYHLQLMIRKYRYLVVSCGINICLTLPHLIISIILDCKKSSTLLWFYLTGYFLSFFPSAFIFIIYVLPSSHYRKEFNELRAYIYRHLEILKLNSSSL